MYSYKTSRTCSRQIFFDIKDGLVTNVAFEGGCAGNTQGVAKLVEGRPVEEVIKLLQGIDCQGRGTSCPDQLAQGLKLALEQQSKE